jgi:hypothetical protein
VLRDVLAVELWSAASVARLVPKQADNVGLDEDEMEFVRSFVRLAERPPGAALIEAPFELERNRGSANRPALLITTSWPAGSPPGSILSSQPFGGVEMLTPPMRTSASDWRCTRRGLRQSGRARHGYRNNDGRPNR